MTKEEIAKDGFFEGKQVEDCYNWIQNAKGFYPEKTEKELYEMYKEMMFQSS